MNTTFSEINWKEISKWKLVLIALGALLVLSILLTVLKSLMGFSTSESLSQNIRFNAGMGESDSVTGMSSPSAPMVDTEMAYDKISSTYERGGYSTGGDAEKYEALSYNVTYKNKNITPICDTIESWKPLSYVVFEHAGRNDLGCNYRFKVERENVNGILEEVEKLHPEDMYADTTTMKKQVVEYEGQLAILLQKQEILEATLQKTTSAYNTVTALATQTQDVENLAIIVRDELNAIKQLTNERVLLAQQIESLAKRSAELQDQIQYVVFSLRVNKYEVIDGSAIKDSWVYKTRQVITDANRTLQDLTLGVIQLLLDLLQVIVYAGVVLVVVVVVGRIGWHFVRSVWSTKSKQDVSEYESH